MASAEHIGSCCAKRVVTAGVAILIRQEESETASTVRAAINRRSQVTASGFCLRGLPQVSVSGACLRFLPQGFVSGYCLRCLSQVTASGGFV